MKGLNIAKFIHTLHKHINFYTTIIRDKICQKKNKFHYWENYQTVLISDSTWRNNNKNKRFILHKVNINLKPECIICNQKQHITKSWSSVNQLINYLKAISAKFGKLVYVWILGNAESGYLAGLLCWLKVLWLYWPVVVVFWLYQ